MSVSRKSVLLALKVAVSGALIVFLLSRVDLAEARDRVLQVAPEMLALSFLGLAIQVVICCFRWRAVLRPMGTDIPFWAAFRLFFIGGFFNQVLPSAVGGDAVRMYLAYRRGLTLGSAINSVMLERVATLSGLLMVMAVILPVFLSRVGVEAGGWAIPVVLVSLFAVVLLIVALSLLDRLPESFRRWRLVRGLALLAGDTRKVFRSPVAAAKAIAWSALGHVNLAFIVFILAVGLQLEVTLIDCLALFPPVLLLMAVPVSIAGWGVREGGMVVAFGFVGVPAEAALVLSLLFGLIVLIGSLPGAVLWLVGGHARDRGATAALSEGVVATGEGR